MQIIKNEHISCFDVDQTLFMHDMNGGYAIANPYSGTIIYGTGNFNHMELLKQHKARGMFIIVWSKAGAKWAENVIDELGLLKYVDLIMTKPDHYVDDLPGDK